ncbi:MAG: HDIG domain-containing metalloprotein [Bacillota bacterium]
MELLQQLLRWLESNGETGFVVGGAVRDRLLGIAPEELDLALTCSPRAIPVGFWREQGCTGYWLDEKREMLRITTAQGERLDLSQLQGKLEEDLRQRDFTCNALACPVAAWLSGELQLTDPLGGEADLRQGRLRPASPDALLRDPVRVLRGVRLLISRDLSFDDAMAKQLKQAARNVADAPPERISQELGKILLDDEAALGVTYLNSLGVTEVLLPEASAMQGVTQNQYHSFAVDDHSLRAFAAFTEIVQQGKYIPPAVRSAALDYWAALPQPLQVATMLGAWLHDIGKPPTRAIRKGRVTFYGHEQVGAQMIGEVARRLRLSNEQAELMRTFIKYHMYPLQLWRSGHLDDRLIHRLYRRTGRWGVLIVLFTLADHLAKGEDVEGSDTFVEHQQVVERMLHAYFSQHDQVIAPRPLLSGDEIAAAVGRPVGPWLRQAKALLLEAQAGGQVQSREEAQEFVRRQEYRQQT